MIQEQKIVSATRRVLAPPALVVALVVLGSCSQSAPGPGSASGGAGQEPSTSSAPATSPDAARSQGDDAEWPEPARGEHDEVHP